MGGVDVEMWKEEERCEPLAAPLCTNPGSHSRASQGSRTLGDGGNGNVDNGNIVRAADSVNVVSMRICPLRMRTL